MFNSRQQRKRTDFPNVTSLLEGRHLVELSLTVPLKCNLLSGPFCYSQLAVEDVYKQGFPPIFFSFYLLLFFPVLSLNVYLQMFLYLQRTKLLQIMEKLWAAL